MIKKIDDLYAAVEKKGRVKLAVAAGEDADVLQAVRAAQDKGMIQAAVAGDVETMGKIAEINGFDLAGMELIQCEDPATSVARVMEMARDGQAQVVMKGNVKTAVFLRGILNREYNIRRETLLSHLAIMEVEGFDRLLFVTDGAVNIQPDLEQKRGILENAVEFVQRLGYPRPNAAVICAVEKASEKMPATMDALELVEMARKGTIAGCNVSGPFALDNALSEHSARIKKIQDPFAGKSDILLMPDIEAGNILFKALVYLAESKSAGVVLGAGIPIVLTSRSDGFDAKLNSIAAAVFMAQGKME